MSWLALLFSEISLVMSSFPKYNWFPKVRGLFKWIYQPKRQFDVNRAVLSRRETFGLFPFQLRKLLTIPKNHQRNGTVDAKISRHEVSSLFELWACGTDDSGDSWERMENPASRARS